MIDKAKVASRSYVIYNKYEPFYDATIMRYKISQPTLAFLAPYLIFLDKNLM